MFVYCLLFNNSLFSCVFGNKIFEKIIIYINDMINCGLLGFVSYIFVRIFI